MKIERCDSCQREGRGHRYRFDYGAKPPGHSPKTGEPVLRLLGQVDQFVCRACERNLARQTMVRSILASAVAMAAAAYLLRDELTFTNLPIPAIAIAGAIAGAAATAFYQFSFRSYSSAVEAALLHRQADPNGPEIMVYSPEWTERARRGGST